MVLNLVVTLSIALVTFSCGQASKQSNDLNDVGLVNSTTLAKLIVYSDGDTLYLKECNSATRLPLSRGCRGTIEKELSLDTYLSSLPFYTGAFSRTDDGLAILNELEAGCR